MPYLTSERKYDLDHRDVVAANPGDLNYQITQLVRAYVDNNGLRYAQLNDVIGALEGAKLEFYRRVVVPYEDQKRHDNGDVYL